MNRKAIITIVAVAATVASALILTADEQGVVCQALCGQAQPPVESE